MVTKNFSVLAVVTASLLGSQLQAAQQERLLEGVPVYDLAAETTVAALAVTDNLSVRPEAGLQNEHTHHNAIDHDDVQARNIAYLQGRGCTPMSEEELRHYHGDPIKVVITSGPNAGTFVHTSAVEEWDHACAENVLREENLQIARQRNAAIANAVGAAGTQLSVLAEQGRLGVTAVARRAHQWAQAHPRTMTFAQRGALLGLVARIAPQTTMELCSLVAVELPMRLFFLAREFRHEVMYRFFLRY